MIVTPELTLMSADELLEIPEDGIERDLLQGRLRELGMTRRNRFHSGAESEIVYSLAGWNKSRPAPRGQVLSGEAGFRLRRRPDTVVGIDVAYISPELAAASGEDTTLIDGPPVLAVEILSPSDKQEDVHDKLREYLACGVLMVWLVDTTLRTVTVHRADAPPALFSGEQLLEGFPALPGFSVRVADFFAVPPSR